MRVRLRYSKLGKVRFTGQRDVARMWERALRRAGLPVAYTEGFSPRPRLGFSLALPTGAESLAEYVDVAFDPARAETAAIDVDGLCGLLAPLLPDGIEVTAAAAVDPRIGSLQQEVEACSWAMAFSGVGEADLGARCRAVLAAPVLTVVRERKGRTGTDDLRPALLRLQVAGAAASLPPGWTPGPGGAVVFADLATIRRGVRPAELAGVLAAPPGVVDAAGMHPVLDRVCRTQQWIERDGVRTEPLALAGEFGPAAGAVHALERAS